MQCSLCGKPDIKTQHGLQKHLSGGKASGGHDMPLDEAGELAALVAEGFVPALPTSKASADEILAVLGGLSETSAASFVNRLLVTLVADKQLPKYQFERRFDCLLAPFLPAIAGKVLGGCGALVVPEFPLKRKQNNQSTNADYLMLMTDRPGQADTWLLVELKTDSNSYDLVQAQIYSEAVRDGWPRLRADLEVIKHASKDKTGYTKLIERVDQAAPAPPSQVEVLYVSPTSIPPHGFHSVHFGDLDDLVAGQLQEVWNILRTLVLPELV